MQSLTFEKAKLELTAEFLGHRIANDLKDENIHLNSVQLDCVIDTIYEGLSVLEVKYQEQLQELLDLEQDILDGDEISNE